MCVCVCEKCPSCLPMCDCFRLTYTFTVEMLENNLLDKNIKQILRSTSVTNTNTGIQHTYQLLSSTTHSSLYAPSHPGKVGDLNLYILMMEYRKKIPIRAVKGKSKTYIYWCKNTRKLHWIFGIWRLKKKLD